MDLHTESQAARAEASACAPGYITPAGRDLRLDILRGYCVFAMVVDHVAGRSPIYLLTGGNRFLTSAAEGFILISGLTAGIASLIAPVSELFRLPWARRLDLIHPVDFVVNVQAPRKTYYLADAASTAP